MPKPKKYDYDAILREYHNGYDTAEIAEITNTPRGRVRDILYKQGLKPNPVRSVQDKQKQKENKQHQEAARIERFRAVIACGGNYEEAGKAIGLSVRGAMHFGKRHGIRSQHKGNAQTSLEAISRYCEECGFAYVGGYSGDGSRVTLRCLTCGAEIERSIISVRHHQVACPQCPKKKPVAGIALMARKSMTAEKNQMIAQKKEAEKIMKRRAKEEHDERQAMLNHVFAYAWIYEPHVCKCCSREYRPIDTGYNSKNYCSERCQKRLYDRKKDVERDHRKRWRKHDTGITLDALYARDHGICYLCGGMCDYSDMSINDGVFIAGNNYPSIDHVQPLARGGTHTWDNVRLAHRICNSIKSDREVATNDANEADSGNRRACGKQRACQKIERRKLFADRDTDAGRRESEGRPDRAERVS